MTHRKGAYDLQRFLEAQADLYEQACAELRGGRKQSHWMWFVFPQIHGLGSSPMAVRYAISSLDEARAYLEHVVLGSRLRESAGILVRLRGKTAAEIFGSPDDMKFHSSMTLFAEAAALPARSSARSAEGVVSVFEEALMKYFGGATDQATMRRIR